jgi:hypothetical protein
MSLIHKGLSVDVRMRLEAQSIRLHLGSDYILKHAEAAVPPSGIAQK